MTDLVLLQSEILPLALSLLLHAFLKLLLGQLHRPHLLVQLVHVRLALLVHLLSVLQRLASGLKLLDLVRGVLFGLDVLRPLLVQFGVFLSANKAGQLTKVRVKTSYTVYASVPQ